MQEFPGGPPPGASVQQARNAVNAPALALVIVAGLGALAALASMFTHGTEVLNALRPMLANNPEALERLEQAQAQAGGFNFGALIKLALAGFIVYGALQMRELKNYGLAMAASIVALIPCYGPCCCLAIPFGIWSLVVLAKPEVKAAFEDAQRGGGGGGVGTV